MPHTRKEHSVRSNTMEYRNYQQTPVLSSDGHPLMPCHPARARKLLRTGRAVPHHVKGIFGIRLLHRTKAESTTQDLSLNIDPGSQTTGVAVVTDSEEGQRTVVGALEIKHRVSALRAIMTRRHNRRGRLRYRAPRFDNRCRKPGTLPPSVDTLRIDTLRVTHTLFHIYPISQISIERNKFDNHIIAEPDISRLEHQHGTLFGTQVRAYILDRDNSRCTYCSRSRVRLELDHVRPRSHGSNRVDNLATSCRDCNAAKADQPIETFLAHQPEMLKRILERIERSDLASVAHVNTALPAIVRDLQTTGLPVAPTDAATVAWNRQRLGVPKTHCYDAALQGSGFTTVASLPSTVLQLRSSNGRSKQKANVDRDGTPIGNLFRAQQRLPRHQREHGPAAGHCGRHQRYGTELIATGDTVQLPYRDRILTGRAVMKSRGTRAAIHGTKPSASAKIDRCRLLSRNPEWVIGRVLPSQQHHAPSDHTKTTP